MAFTDDWDTAFEAIPAGTDKISDLDTIGKTHKLAIRERMNTDHEVGESAEDGPDATQLGDGDSGYHRKVTLKDLNADPTAVAGHVVLGSQADHMTEQVTEGGEVYPLIGENPWKVSVRVATVSALTLATDFENGDTVDGTVLATGDFFLNKDAASGDENGFYEVQASGAPSRLEAYKTAESIRGAVTYVKEGTLNAGKYFKCTNTGAITVDTTALTFIKVLQSEDYILILDEQTFDTDGGTFTTGEWRTRTLTTEKHDTGSNASLSSNEITLLKGTYRCRIVCGAHKVALHQAILYNHSDTSIEVFGLSAIANTAVGTTGNSVSIITGRFTIAATKIFKILHQCNASQNTNGFGKAVGFAGTTNIYTQAEFWKEN